MTNEEAIEYLKLADTTVGKKIKTRIAEALEMAIRALKNEQTDGDLISRKQAEECCLNGWNKDYKDILEDIRKLPSEKVNGDLISRESVITMLNKIENAVEDGDGFQFNEWVEYAKDIPSAEKRQNGLT